MNAATPTIVHTAWLGASWLFVSRSMRVMTTKPMPLSSAASGRSVASARGASRRTARCAAT